MDLVLDHFYRLEDNEQLKNIAIFRRGGTFWREYPVFEDHEQNF
jgi:hypothetical protein